MDQKIIKVGNTEVEKRKSLNQKPYSNKQYQY